jgi:mono/diheme cytochrome c family protein
MEMTRATLALAAALLAAMVAAADTPPRPEGNEERFKNLMLSLGERDFALHCAVCHGLDARGDGRRRRPCAPRRPT